MADENEIRISIVLDDGSVREGFARIKKDGQDSGKHMAESFEKAKHQLILLLEAYVGFEVGKHIIEESIHAAQEYETALNNMNKALSSAGTYSKEASHSFLELAEHLEHTTTLSANQVLGLEALARNYAATNEQAKALTKASIDLSAATGKSAESSLQKLASTLDGTAGSLGKLVPQLRTLTEYQLRAGDAIGVVAARFKDAAAGDINTFSGSIQKLKNSLENLYTSLGNFITQSPSIRAVIKFLGEEFSKLGNYFKGVSLEGFFKGAITGAVLFARVINTMIIMPLEMIYDVARTTFDGIRELFQLFIMGAAKAASAVANYFAPSSKTAIALKAFADSSTEVFKEFVDKTNEGLKKLGDTTFSDTLGADLAKLQETVSNSKPFAPFKGEIASVNDDMLRLSGPLESVGMAFAKMAQGARSSMAIMAADSQKYMLEIGASVNKVLIAGVANAMAQMGRALIQGKDIFKAFAGAMMSALGQAAIQMGAMYILLGTARVYGSYGADATGWGLIGTGAAMSVLGGVLMALGEGVSGGASAGAGGGGGGSAGAIGAAAPVTDNPANQIESGERKSVVVNIHGSVFDARETGLRIVELVNDAFNTQGAQVLVK